MAEPIKRKKTPRAARSYRGARRNQRFGRFPKFEGHATLEQRRLIRIGLSWREVKYGISMAD